MLALLIPRK
jgi:hypothetical protein